MRKILPIICVFLLCGCSGQALQQVYDAQEKKIDAFVTSQRTARPDMRVEYQNGAVRMVLTEGTSDNALSAGGTVSFYYAGYLFNGSVPNRSNLFATNSKDVADAAGWTLSDESLFAIETVSLPEKELIDGLRNGLVGVREGEVCFILFSGKYGYGKKAAGPIPAKSALLYHILVQSISND